LLRPGNVHSAEGWRGVLEPVIARYRGHGLTLYFRGDAAFAKPELYKLLEAEGISYAICLPANAGSAGADRSPADPARRPPAEEAAGVLRQLHLPGPELGEAAPGVGQGRVAPGRAVPRVGFIVTT
jgi:Transposase DDE domain group 1